MRSGTETRMIHDGVSDRPPEIGVGLVLAVNRPDPEHEAVVVEPHPARRRQQVVVGERVVEAEHHRPRREEREADDPRREEREHRRVLAQRHPPPRTPALGRRAHGGRRPPRASVRAPSTASPPAGSGCRCSCRAAAGPSAGRRRCPPATWRRSRRRAARSPRRSAGAAGRTPTSGCSRSSTNVWNCGPRLSFGESPDAFVVGTFPRLLASATR